MQDQWNMKVQLPSISWSITNMEKLQKDYNQLLQPYNQLFVSYN